MFQEGSGLRRTGVSCSGEHRIGGSLEQAGLLCASFGGSWAHIIADKLLSHVDVPGFL